ncbi:MAG: hypothetical protein HY288_14540 [Planctomycetia bacterium]|nr:hypothetical protein [Planctomycetia bacterium]
MNGLKKCAAACQRCAGRIAWVVLAIYFWSLGSPAIAAAKKKVAEEVETKSYTMPYLIVIMLIGVGLMAICRPSRRADKPDEKIKPDED